MAKTYIHPDGSEVIQIKDTDFYLMVPLNDFPYVIPGYLLEANGWQLQEEIQVPPPRIPIVILKDENGKDVELFDGDKYWFVTDTWQVDLNHIGCHNLNFSKNTRARFATQAAAVKYVRENKPVLPASYFDEVEYWRNQSEETPTLHFIQEKYKHFIK